MGVAPTLGTAIGAKGRRGEGSGGADDGSSNGGQHHFPWNAERESLGCLLRQDLVQSCARGGGENGGGRVLGIRDDGIRPARQGVGSLGREFVFAC